jgi:protein-disulfide isomerase
MNEENINNISSESQADVENLKQELSKKQKRRLRRMQQKEAQSLERGRKKTIKKMILWAFVALAIGGAAYGMVLLAIRAPAENGQSGAVSAITENDWVKGNRDASVALIEYSDFQCPACASYFPIVTQLVQNFGDDIAFVYRHFPLRQHANAEIAGQAAEAAGKQGKFFEMHDLIFENQSFWENQSKSKAQDTFEIYASQLGLDINKFNIDRESEATVEKVKNDFQSGVRAGVNATPTFFLNGEKLNNPRSLKEFSTLIQEALSQTSGADDRESAAE